MNPIKKNLILCIMALVPLCLFSACSGNDPVSGNTTVSEKINTSEKAAATENTISSENEITSENTSAPENEPSSENATTPENTSSENTTTPENTSSPEAASETESTEPVIINREFVLATLNIKHGAEGLETVAEAIREISPDIIGLEEVDVFCERSGYMDEPAELAQLAGYPYYAFSKAISLGDGEYGTAILSRYPIESFEVIPLESGNGESRSVGHALISVDGLKLDTFVTHLSYEKRSLRIEQMETIAELVKDCDHYIVLGDFNSFDLEDIIYLGCSYYVNRPDRRYTTFRRWDAALDNIAVSEAFTELSSGLSDRECSDHKLLYAVFRFISELPATPG